MPPRMTLTSALIILATVLVTTFISGIFGMAGGIIFMGVLATLVPVATAMIIHGSIQMISNAAMRWARWRRSGCSSRSAGARTARRSI
jgi:uncharacterized membrane protein YfcA